MAIRVELTPLEFQRIQQEWNGSRYQMFVHNSLVDQITNAEKTIPNCEDWPSFEKAKARLNALKEVLGLIHERDSDTQKKTYGLK